MTAFDPAATRTGYGAIDIVVNVFTPEAFAEGRIPTDGRFREQVRTKESDRRGVSIEDYLRKMDRAGIERSFLIAVRCGDLRVKGSVEIPYEWVRDICAKYPDVAIKDYGFVGGHLYPHWFSEAPDSAIYYPYYARCAELGVPIMMQVGHCLVYQQDRRLPSVGRPITLDKVAIHFPELAIIGIHLGYPWTDEMISCCTKHPNVYMAGDAYAPKHWPPQAVHYANTYGQDKFLFGTDWSVIDPERAMNEMMDLDFRPEPLKKILRNNAIRLFNLPDAPA
jgi:predicted TIM-barrel fold metal-dependent hydrolase